MHTKGLLFGIAIGDALGVPVEFMSRKHLQANPVTSMREFGTHHQPAGTWSDDTAMSFLLVEQLIEGYDINELGKNFPIMITLDFMPNNILEIITQVPKIKGINMTLAESSNKNDIHYFNYFSVLDILSTLNK